MTRAGLVPALLTGLFGAILTLGALAFVDPAINNGDYWRVARHIGVVIPRLAAPESCIPFTREAYLSLPGSSLSIFGYALSMAARAFGSSCLPMTLWYSALAALFWSGVILGTSGVSRIAQAVIVVAAAVHFIVFSPLLASFYEEAFLFAFAPWLALLSVRDWVGAVISAGIVGLTLLTKSQAIFFAPILLIFLWPVWGQGRGLRFAGLTVLTVLLCAYAFLSAHGTPNGYNRIYNGLGWAALQAADWPARDFTDRRAYFQAQPDTAWEAEIRQACAPPGVALMGTSYWPTGSDVMRAPEGTQTQMKAHIEGLGFGDYLDCLIEIGQPGRVLGQVAEIFLLSDYALAYILPVDGPAVNAASAALLGYGGVLFVVLSGAIVLFSRHPRVTLAVFYLVAGTPYFIFIGDGFFEFEKHVIVNFAGLLPCLIFACRLRNPDRQDLP